MKLCISHLSLWKKLWQTLPRHRFCLDLKRRQQNRPQRLLKYNLRLARFLKIILFCANYKNLISRKRPPMHFGHVMRDLKPCTLLLVSLIKTAEDSDANVGKTIKLISEDNVNIWHLCRPALKIDITFQRCLQNVADISKTNAHRFV